MVSYAAAQQLQQKQTNTQQSTIITIHPITRVQINHRAMRRMGDLQTRSLPSEAHVLVRHISSRLHSIPSDTGG